MQDRPHATPPSAVDIVWDGNLRGTALSHSGRRLRVGAGGDWPPDTLVALAYGASVMETFLTLAARAKVGLLAYVCAVSVEARADGTRTVVLSPCVMVGSAGAIGLAERLLERAAADAPLASWVSAHVEVRPHVHPPAAVAPHAADRVRQAPGERQGRRERHGRES